MDLIYGGGFSLSVVLEGGSLLATYPYDKPNQHGNLQHFTVEQISIWYTEDFSRFPHLQRMERSVIFIVGTNLKKKNPENHILNNLWSINDPEKDVGSAYNYTGGLSQWPEESWDHSLNGYH